MTKYTTEELDHNWEFKIVRSESGAFRKPEIFQRLLQEEALAGWEMVEKLDNRRVRFKRQKDARRRDTNLPPGFDPYRTQFGSSTQRMAIVIGVAIMLALMIGFAVIGFGRSGGGSEMGTAFIWPLITIIGVLVLIMGVIALRRGR